MGGASKFFMLLSTPYPLLCPRPSALRLARHSRVSLARFCATPSRGFAANSRPGLGFSIRASEQIHTQIDCREDYGESIGFSPNNRLSHPWPEWSKLVENLRSGGYFDRMVEGDGDDSFLVIEDLPEEFVRVANACLLFARDRSDLLRSLSKKDIEVIVENGAPFLFKNAMNSKNRLRSFLGGNVSEVLEFDKAQTVDVMRFLLSYAYNPLVCSGQSNFNNGEIVEASVRNLLKESVDLNATVRESGLFGTTPRQVPVRYDQFPTARYDRSPTARYDQSLRPFGQNIEMKRGDWICPKCSFMNFARNMKCLECDEERPKRQLTGGEWECPQCDFFNYGRNAVCLRCDCKRPGEVSYGVSGPRSDIGYSQKPNTGQSFHGICSDKTEIEKRLAANDGKAEQRFNKISQLDGASDLSSAVADEDVPEMMPLRKGFNRFVVSTRKTPLERRLANAQYRRNLGNDGSAEGNNLQNNFQSGDASNIGSDNTSKSSIGQSLDRILGRSTTASGADRSNTVKNDNPSGVREKNTGTEERLVSPQYEHGIGNQGNGSECVPFVPLPADMVKPHSSKTEEQVTDRESSVAPGVGAGESSFPGSTITGKVGNGLPSKKQENQSRINKDKDPSDASERWFKKVAELHDVTDLASAISDEEFPEIMPMRKGENHFVVSKKKDRSLTSPQYKRRLAMEQANSSNFVPFVPFPPDYFAKKDKQTEPATASEKTASDVSTVPPAPEEHLMKNSEENKFGSFNWGSDGNSARSVDYEQHRMESWTTGSSTQSLRDSKIDSGNMSQQTANSEVNARDRWNTGVSGNQKSPDAVNMTGGLTQQLENQQNSRENWNGGFTGKSLEGSAVKEPDPLDMSEEAKAQRWF